MQDFAVKVTRGLLERAPTLLGKRKGGPGPEDFAYWYRRAPGVPIMETGMIAQFANPAEGNGRALLVRDGAPGTGRYGVVSDGVVLLRGGYARKKVRATGSQK